MDVNKPDFMILCNFSIIENINVKVIYSLAYGSETVGARHVIFENPDEALPNKESRSIAGVRYAMR